MAGDWWPGGIWWLLDLIEEHRAAVEYDWRARFHLSLSEAGVTVPLDEAARLTRVLSQDVTSQTHAAMAGWSFPMTREAFALMDLYDLTLRINHDPKKKFTPHAGRPFEVEDKTTKRMGNTGGRTRAEVVAILNAHGHNLN